MSKGLGVWGSRTHGARAQSRDPVARALLLLLSCLPALPGLEAT